MFSTSLRSANAYSAIGIETAIDAADPHKLVLMLFDGALLAISDARRHLTAGATADKGRSITKAIMIVDHGLKASLDMASGGELAYRLASLYDYLCRQLLVANAHNSVAELEEVRRLLTELRGAWEKIGRLPGGACS